MNELFATLHGQPIKYLAVALFGSAVALLVLSGRQREDSVLRLAWLRHVRRLTERSSVLQRQRPQAGLEIARLQVTVLVLVLVGWWLAFLPGRMALVAMGVCCIGPDLLLRRAGRRRLAAIERELNPFLTALANSLRSTPSIGKALGRVEGLTTGPLANELRHLGRELQVGASVDQGLLNMSARIGSESVDSALTGILIGRQVGGNIPDILEETANTLREIDRLHGLLRAKTAEGKGQMMVIAAAPPVVFFAFDQLSPGYFTRLTQSSAGWSLLIAACVLWLGSMALAKSILKVDI